MSLLQWIYYSILILILLCAFTAFAMTFYLGRNKMKKVDMLVYGFEIPNDSIFYQLLRLPRYGGAFASRWGARRAHLLFIRDQFDKNFQRPFIVTFYLLMIGGISMILLAILDNFILHVVD